MPNSGLKNRRVYSASIKRLCLFVMMVVGSAMAQTNKVADFAAAIARTEGFYVKGSIPNRYRNPGDLKVRRGEKYPGQIGIGKAGHVIFRNNTAGWDALFHQINKMMTGDSRFYDQRMTLLQVGKKYATNSKLWAKNTAHNLGVPVTMTLEEYFELPPRLRFEGDYAILY